MSRTRWYRSLLTSVCLLVLAGPGPTSTVTAAFSPEPLQVAPSLCQWTAQSPDWLTGGQVLPSNSGQPTPGVRYAAAPDQAFRVLVDQPTGTIFVLSPGPTSVLTVLQGATRTPPAWFPSKPPAGGGKYLVGTAVQVADGRGQVYFTCGGGLYQLAPDGQPQPVVVSSLPVGPEGSSPVVVDERAHRLFTLVGSQSGQYLLAGFDTRTGKELFERTVPLLPGTGSSVLIGPLAVDARGGHVYIAENGYIPGSVGPSAVYVLNLQGKVVGKLPGFESSGGTITQLALAGTTRRLIVFGCQLGSGPEAELLQVLNLTTGRYLTASPLHLGACGTGYSGSLLNNATPGILAVDAAAGTAVVVSYTWAGMSPYLNELAYPGFAWLITLHTGEPLTVDKTYGCVEVGHEPSAVAIDSELHRAYVASSGDGLVTMLDTRTGQMVGQVHVGSVPASIAVDTHDDEVVVALDGYLGQAPTWGGVAFFPADLHQAKVPTTKSCVDEGAPYFLGAY